MIMQFFNEYLIFKNVRNFRKKRKVIGNGPKIYCKQETE